MLLKYEFIFSGGGLEVNLENTLNDLSSANIISFINDCGRTISIDSKEDKWVTLSSEERRIGRENFGKPIYKFKSNLFKFNQISTASSNGLSSKHTGLQASVYFP